MTMKMKRYEGQAGFTLIELMITLVIASILISLTLPSYLSSVRKARRTEAKTAMLDLAGREERYFNTNNTYTNVAANLGYAPGGSTAVTAMPVGSGYYTVTISSITAGSAGPPPTPPAYTIIANPTGDQVKDTSCYVWTLMSNGTQTSTDSSSGDSTATCWK